MNTNLFKVTLNILNSGSILTNLALSGYLFFFNEVIYDWFFYDTVQEISSGIIYHGKTNPVLGVILLLAVAGEFIAFILKSRYGRQISNGSEGGFFLWMFHTVVSVIMTIIALGDSASPLTAAIMRESLQQLSSAA